MPKWNYVTVLPIELKIVVRLGNCSRERLSKEDNRLEGLNRLKQMLINSTVPAVSGGEGD
jgi:hypothetical protein